MTNKVYELFKTILKYIKNNLLFCIIVLILLICIFVRIPYEVEMPGGIISLNDRVLINGKEINPSGTYNMAYVSAVNGSIPYVIAGLIIPDWEVNKTSELIYENEDMEDYYTRNKLYLDQSKSIAKLAALEAAEKEYEILKQYNYIAYIDEESETDLKIGDELISVEGLDEFNNDKLREYIDSKEIGDTIKITVNRNGKEVECNAKVKEIENNKVIGVAIIIYYDIKCDYDIEIASKGSESGPSGGMMMSLMIYSGITETDLTHGKKIVGTGTINQNGEVGSIGGVKFKIQGAVKANADIFLVPEGNYEEAKSFVDEKNYDIIIVSVKTLRDAIDYLEGLDE